MTKLEERIRAPEAADWDWPYFTFDEMSSPDENGIWHAKMDPAFMDVLIDFREALGKPIHLNSAYRTPYWNERVGGRPRSYHKKGMAVDPSMKNQDRYEFVYKAMDCGFTGIIIYKNFVHLDTRPGKPYLNRGPY